MPTNYGWNPNQKVINWLKARVKEKTGKHDSTFLEASSLRFRSYDGLPVIC